MDPRCRIELLGGLRVLQDGRIITRFSTHKTAALLAYLAYHPQSSHSRQVLIDLCWPASTPAAGRASLSMALSSLRHQLEPPRWQPGVVIVADRNNVGLNPDAVTTDVAQFEAAVLAANRATTRPDRLRHLADAAECYRGRLLPGYYEDWTLLEQTRLEDLYLQVLHRLFADCEQTGDRDGAIVFAHRALSVDPLREEAHHDLMRLYVANDQPEQALRQYHALERLLDQELGETLAPETRSLAHQIERDRPATPGRREGSLAPEGGARCLPAVGTAPPSGTVTFLLTGIDRSAAEWEHAGEAFAERLTTHHALLREVFARFGAHEVSQARDGFVVAFARPTAALACAVACQRALLSPSWPEAVAGLPVRMALFTGEVEVVNGEYHGLALHRAARVLAAAENGGQILCGEATAVLARRDLEAGVCLTEAGCRCLQDGEEPEPLYQVDYPQVPRRDFPPLRAKPGAAGNLPLTLTRFFGREIELARLRELLMEPDTRLITLTGPGGAGKTRLALEFAARQQQTSGGPVWFVPLVDTRDELQIVSALCQSLRLTQQPGQEPLDPVIILLSRQPCLLALDNFEQILETGRGVVETLLARVPLLKLVITSRRRLDIVGEREFAVGPLPTPNGTATPERLIRYGSVQLFVDRAQAVRPDFQVTTHNALAVAELCNRLEGIPLAIELAASRVQTLTPLHMLSQLENRFALLVSRRRGADERHQTLWAAIDWSYRLLSPELQRFFARLSVFRGGWTAEAAATVCDAPLAMDYLAQLRACSLTKAEEIGGAVRYGMLETIREFAHEHLDEETRAVVARRHADYFLALAQEAATQSQPSGQVSRLDRLESEHDNLRAALDWCKKDAESADSGLRLAGALGWFWSSRSYLREGRALLEDALACSSEAPVLIRAHALSQVGVLAWHQADFASADRYAEESIALWREWGDKQHLAQVLRLHGIVLRDRGDFRKARALLEEALTNAREYGDTECIAGVLHALGVTAFYQGDFAAAHPLYEEGLALRREIGDHTMAWSLYCLGVVELDTGDFASAEARFQEGLPIFCEFGYRQGVATHVEVFAWLAAARSQALRAAKLFGASHAQQESIGFPLWPYEQVRHDAYTAAARAAVGDAAFEAAWAEGRAMTLEQAVAYSLEN